MLITTVLVFLLILSILVLIHELGHFVAAKKLGIKVEEFGFGLPPRIWGVKRGETTYSVNWLPIGGFVKLFGEEGEDENQIKIQNSRLRASFAKVATKAEQGYGGQAKLKTQKYNSKLKNDNRAFYGRPIWQRVVVLTAGVAMNFLLGIFILSFLFTQGVMVPTKRVHIEKVVSGSPAEVVGLKNGDVIKTILIEENIDKFREIEIDSLSKLSETTREFLGKTITLVVLRGQEQMPIDIIPRVDYSKDEGPMGIVISNYEEKKYSLWEAPIYGTKEAMLLTYELVKGIGTTLWKLISFQPVAKDVAGPIGIAQLTGEAVKFGRMAVLELLGILSLNLAIVNILPFPALDGGRLLFVLIEGTTGRKIKAAWERLVHQVGMAILLALLILVTINDLVRILSK